MMEPGEYNGWTNYETWLVALWIGNEEWSESESREFAQEARRMHPEDAVRDLAETLREWVGEMTAEPASLKSDLIGAALAEVNWAEIAESYLEDVGEEGEEVE